MSVGRHQRLHVVSVAIAPQLQERESNTAPMPCMCSALPVTSHQTPVAHALAPHLQERESYTAPEPCRLLERSIFSDRMVFVRAVHAAKFMNDTELSIYDAWCAGACMCEGRGEAFVCVHVYVHVCIHAHCMHVCACMCVRAPTPCLCACCVPMPLASI